jgi:hypothetical protein
VRTAVAVAQTQHRLLRSTSAQRRVEFAVVETDAARDLQNHVACHAGNVQRILNGLADSAVDLRTMRGTPPQRTTPRTKVLSLIFFTEGRFASRNTFSVSLRTPSEMSLQFSNALSALSNGCLLKPKPHTYAERLQLDQLTELAEVRNALLNLDAHSRPPVST